MVRPLPRAVVWSLVALALVLILVPTLYPMPGDEPAPLAYCIVCGEMGTADVLTNIILFLPLGVALGFTGARSRWLILGGALLSGAIETAQLVIPGRDPSVGDLLFNTLGGAIGVTLVRTAGRWLAPDRTRARALLLAATGLVIVVLGGTAWALQPALPDSRYFGQWTPNLGQLQWYRARVLRATLGAMPLPPHRLADSAAVRQRLLRGDTIEIRGIAGPPVGALGSLFSIFDDHQREILLLGPDRADLVLRYRTRASDLRLDAPDLRLLGAMRGIRRGDTLMVRVHRAADGWCVALDAQSACRLGHTLGRAWALLMYPESFPPWLRHVLDAAWMAGLLLPLGLWARSGWHTLGAAVAVTAACVAIPVSTGLRPLTALEWLGMAVGAAAGLAIARLTRTDGHSAPRSP